MKIKNLTLIREEINIIDDLLVYLFFKRLELIQKIGYIKKQFNIPINDTCREQEIIQKCIKRADTFQIPKKYIELIFNILFIQSKIYENQILHIKI